jgi:hypothetical protein
MDKLTPARRSENMRRIKSKHTKPELLVRRSAFRLGLATGSIARICQESPISYLQSFVRRYLSMGVSGISMMTRIVWMGAPQIASGILASKTGEKPAA